MASAPTALAQTGISTQLDFSNQVEWQKPEPTGRLIIKYVAADLPWQSPRGSKRVSRSTLRQDRQLLLKRKLTDKRELVVSANTDIKQLKAQALVIGAQSDVEYASVEYRRYAYLQPNDPLYQGSQNPGNQSYLYQGDYSIHAPGAWDITTGSESSIIAIVDTGVRADHPEIANRSVSNLGYDFVSADIPGDFTSANDGDGRDDNPADPGDACNGGSSSWHGTAVASVAAGDSNNSEGLAGIDWNARLLHARALGICGGTDADIIDAIRWSAGLSVAGVADNPAPASVVNLSLGGATECTKAWQDVIDELTELNVVFVMAAGNERQNALRSSPANCANVISVGSSTTDGDIDDGYSNHGLPVTIATSGSDIVVASNAGLDAPAPDGDNYRTETGTSFSAAIVSGAISLMHSINPDLGPADVRAVLQDSATRYANNSNCEMYYCGGGVLNLARALTALNNGNYNRDRNAAVELIESQSSEIDLLQAVDVTLFGFKDVRYFTINVSQRGLLQAESSGTEDVYAYLLNSDLSVIALDDDSGSDFNFRVASLVDPGTYYIAVERSLHRRFDAELQFSMQASLSDDAPDAFVFSSVSDADADDVVESNTVVISGLQNETVLTVSNGFYSLNGDTLDNTPATIRNGDTLKVLIQSSGAINRTNTATITVGTYSTSFSVTTAPAANSLTGSTSDDSNGASGNSGCTIAATASASATSYDPLLLLLLSISSLTLIRRSHRRTSLQHALGKPKR